MNITFEEEEDEASASTTTNPMMDQPPPPSYASLASPLPPSTSNFSQHAAFDHVHSPLGLPSGYFILRNRGSGGRVLDLLGHRANEGAVLGLHPLKSPQVEGSDLQIKANNQIFFVGWDGLVYSAAVSRAVEAQDGSLAIAIPHPVMSIPSQRSHPTSRFSFDSTTSTLHVQFPTDPSFPGPLADAQTNWRDYEYLVEAVPCKKRKNDSGLWGVAKESIGVDLKGGILGSWGERIFGKTSPSLNGPGSLTESVSNGTTSEGVTTTLTSTTLKPPYETYQSRRRSSGSIPTVTSSTTQDHASGSSESFPFRPTASTSRQDPSEDSDSDDEPSAMRAVRVVALPRSSWREKFPIEALSRPNLCTSMPPSRKHLRMWKRRQWEVIPVIVRAAPTDGQQVLNPAPSTPPRRSPNLQSQVQQTESPRSRLFSSPSPSPTQQNAAQFVPLPASPSLGNDEDPLPQKTANKSNSSSVGATAGVLPRMMAEMMRTNIYGRRLMDSDEEESLFDKEDDARDLDEEEIVKSVRGLNGPSEKTDGGVGLGFDLPSLDQVPPLPPKNRSIRDCTAQEEEVGLRSLESEKGKGKGKEQSFV